MTVAARGASASAGADRPALDVRRMRRALAALVAGTAVVLAGFEINGFDLVNDVAGMALVAAAVVWLTARRAGPRHDLYRPVARGTAAVALALTVGEEVGLVLRADGQGLDPLLGAIGLWVAIVGVTVVALHLRDLSRVHGLTASVRRWRTTVWLIVLVYVVPVGLLHAATLLLEASGGTFSLRAENLVGLPALLVAFVTIAELLLAVVPIAAFLWAAVKMRSEVQRGAAGPFTAVAET